MIMKHLIFIILLGVRFNSLNSQAPGQRRILYEEEEEDKIDSSACTYNVNKSEGLSKNGTLNPSDVCVWNIICNDSQIGSSGLLFEKVHLDADDHLAVMDVNGTVIFEYSGSQGPLVIVVDEKKFTVKLNVSKKIAVRSFLVIYSENCVFNIPPSIAVIESPIYRAKPKLVSCTYDFKNTADFVSYSFVFKSFSLNSESSVDISKADGPTGTYITTPPDIFGLEARFNMTLNINSTGNNLTIVRRDLYHSCSQYIEIPKMLFTVLRSPPAMTSYNDTVKFECRWLIKTNDADSILGLVMDKLQFSNIFDVLIINNGPSELSPPMVQATLLNQEEIKGQIIKSSGQYLWVSFKSEAFASNFSGNCSEGKGGYYKDSGSISSQSNAEFLLEVDVDEKVLLNFISSNFTSPATLSIYDGFATTSSLITQLIGNVWYPVISDTSKMMVVVKNFDSGNTFVAHFSGIKSDCIHMSSSSDDSYVVSGNCNMTCAWVMPPKNASNEALQLEFHLVSLDANDVIQVFRLGDNQTPVAKILHGAKHIPPLTFDPREGFYMNVSRGVCQSNEVVLIAHATYLPGCSRNFSLVTSGELQLSTPNYPNMYPLLASCEWNLVTSGSTIQSYLAFESINLAPGHCIQINHTVGGVTKTELMTGNKLPNDMLLQNATIRFDSFSCNKPGSAIPLISGEGFVLNVTGSDCGSILRAKTGQFNTSLPATKSQSACFWVVEVPYNETDGSVNSIMLTVEETDGKKNNSEFYIHDGPSVREPVITNYTGNTWSRNNTVIFVYKRFNSTVSSNVYTVNYKTINCNKTNQCGNGICLHPDWRCNGENDCGDFTDERNCGTVPVPEPQKEANKISSVTFGVVTVLFFILGALAAFLIPKAISRYRSGRYHQFQDYSNVD